MATIQRAGLQRGDIALWDGLTKTTTRPDSTGATITGLTVGDFVDVLQVYGLGADRTAATISSAVSKIGSNKVELVFATGTWTIDANITIPSNFVCSIPAGCTFSISNGITLTINGPIVAPLSQIFSGSGTVALGGLGGPAFPQWWGAAGDGTTSDTAAFTSAVAPSVDVYAGDGTWMIQGVTVPDGQSIHGDGRQTVLKKRANGAVLSLAKNAQVRDLYIDGNGASFTGAGITIPATVEFDGFQHVYNCVIRNTASYCVEYSAEFAGYCSILMGCDFKTTDEFTTPAVKWGVETSVSKHGNRLIIGCTAGSGPIVDASGSQNGWVVGCMAGGSSVAGIAYNSASAKIIAIGNRLAATAAQTIDGTAVIFQGNVVAGQLSVAATADGSVITGNYSGNITLAAGAKRCVVKGNAGSTVTDNSGSVGSESNLVEITHVAYTPALSSANADASLGDGTLTGYFSRNGRTVKATVRLIFGTTTTFGTGAIRITLPFTPSTDIPQQGAALLLDAGTQFHVATARTLTSGAGRVEIYASAASGVTGAVPFTFTTNDEIQFTIVYDM
jgi:hypothetical protein